MMIAHGLEAAKLRLNIILNFHGVFMCKVNYLLFSQKKKKENVTNVFSIHIHGIKAILFQNVE